MDDETMRAWLRLRQRAQDLVEGSADADWLDGTGGDDRLVGGDGDDDLQGYTGDDRLEGGAGLDVAWYSEAGAGVWIDLEAGTARGGDGNDTLTGIEGFGGSDHDDEALGSAQSNLLWGGGGNDRLVGRGGDDVLSGDAGDDQLEGDGGYDYASFTLAASAVVVDLNQGTADGDGHDTLRGIEGVLGSMFADTLRGDADDNDFTGLAGDDRIDGGSGRDYASYWSSIVDAEIVFDPVTQVLTVATDWEGTDTLTGVEALLFDEGVFEVSWFQQPAPPRAIWMSPQHGSQDVRVQQPLTFLFNEPILRGQGSINIVRIDTGQVVQYVDVASAANLTIDGRQLVIETEQPLPRGTHLAVQFSEGALVDAQGQPMRSEGSWSFTTRTSVEINLERDLVAHEADGTLRVTVGLSEPVAQPVTGTVWLYDINFENFLIGTATWGGDYTNVAQQVRFAPGQTVQELRFELTDDAAWEASENLFVVLSEVTGPVVGGDTTIQAVIVDDDNPLADWVADPLAPQQWHLFPDVGVNAWSVWPDYTGAGVRVGVFDQGIDPGHTELDGNLLVALGRDAATLQPGGSPRTRSDNHGTAVAGVVAAERNGLGPVGVAYDASLVSIYSPLDASFTPTEIEHALTHALEVDVLNNSWGYAPQYFLDDPWAFYDDFEAAEFAGSGQALRTLAERGRNGLGTVVVQSAGNSFDFGDDTNLHGFQNSRYIVTVGATGPTGEVSSYSSPGASVLVAAPGGEGWGGWFDVLTTDRTGRAGYESGDITRLAGTSFSAPVVSGVVALMLEANAQLGWRDVQAILALSAHDTATTSSAHDWRANGATAWNGGGLLFDAEQHDLGFGIVDARAAVRLAEAWHAPARTSANLVQVQAGRTDVATIPDNDTALQQQVRISEDISVERAEVTLDLRHDYIGDLEVLLVSPQGTRSWLVSRPGQNERSPYGLPQKDIRFTFSTVLNLGESSVGDWSLQIFDREAEDVGTLQAWTLTLTGSTPDGDDTYYYSDRYGELATAESTRAVLADATGSDTLHAGMVTTPVTLDLQPGASPWIDGHALTVATGTQIEHAVGGDAGDLLIGNAAANRLSGMRGDDVLRGNGGDDTLDGGAGLDEARFLGLRADYQLQVTAEGLEVHDLRGADGRDALHGIERVVFGDIAVAFDTADGGHAAQVAQILRAVLGPASLREPLYAGIGLQLADQGMSVADLVALAVATPLFEQLAGSRSNTDFVRLVYRQVVGQEADAASLATYVGMLDSGAISQDALALLAVQSTLNVGSAELVGLASTGLAYLPQGG
ncbi:MAG: S8 family serine peptidase [Burkholderiaceae bacterium]|nr:S8 family serine peptidase [Aquabacterium sp.]NUP86895.1 S8 family serine peptidase [Burkholderiaceae bacterium]